MRGADQIYHLQRDAFYFPKHSFGGADGLGYRCGVCLRKSLKNLTDKLVEASAVAQCSPNSGPIPPSQPTAILVLPLTVSDHYSRTTTWPRAFLPPAMPSTLLAPNAPFLKIQPTWLHEASSDPLSHSLRLLTTLGCFWNCSLFMALSYKQLDHLILPE